jgi:hypothetical protein
MVRKLPYAKRLLSSPGYVQEVDGRDYQLFEARERIQTWFPFYHYTPEIEAFLHLIEALEREREFSIALYGGHTLHFLALAQEQWPASTEDATFIQPPHGILNAGMATKEEKILKLLSSIEFSRYHIDQSIHSGVMDVSSNSTRLKSRLQYYTSEMQNDTVVAFAELVESMD